MVSIGECFSLSVYRWIGIRYGTESVESLRELAAFFVFGTFLLGLYYDIVWLQWVTAILFILPMAGVLRYPSRCKERQEPFVKARFAWSLITMFLYLGMGFGLLTIL